MGIAKPVATVALWMAMVSTLGAQSPSTRASAAYVQVLQPSAEVAKQVEAQLGRNAFKDTEPSAVMISMMGRHFLSAYARFPATSVGESNFAAEVTNGPTVYIPQLSVFRTIGTMKFVVNENAVAVDYELTAKPTGEVNADRQEKFEVDVVWDNVRRAKP